MLWTKAILEEYPGCKWCGSVVWETSRGDIVHSPICTSGHGTHDIPKHQCARSCLVNQWFLVTCIIGARMRDYLQKLQCIKSHCDFRKPTPLEGWWFINATTLKGHAWFSGSSYGGEPHSSSAHQSLPLTVVCCF